MNQPEQCLVTLSGRCWNLATDEHLCERDRGHSEDHMCHCGHEWCEIEVTTRKLEE